MTRARDIANFGDGIATADIDDGAVTAGKLNSTLDLTGKTVTLPAGVGGKVLQVVQELKQNTFSGTADLGSFEDITGLNASITPSSTNSKVLVIVTVYMSPNTSNYTLGTRLKRFIAGDAFTYLGDTRSSSTRMSTFGKATSGGATFMGFTFQDTPSSTSSITYTVQAASEGGTNYIVGGSSDSGNQNKGSVPSTIVLMEIAG